MTTVGETFNSLREFQRQILSENSKVKSLLKNKNKTSYDLIKQTSGSMKQLKNHEVEGEQKNMLNNTRR